MSKIKNKINNAIDNAKEKIKGKNRNRFLMLLVTIGICIATSIIVFSIYIMLTAPDFNTTKLYSKEASIIYDRNGEEVTRIGVGIDEENRALVTYSDLPQVFIDALIATEDSRFFQHSGFDAARFLKASINQAMGKDAGGASTLTMQIAKNTYNGKETSITRKFKDIYMAVFKIEKKYTKEEIIEFYVNSQWLGKGSTNYQSVNGVEQACQAYFGKSVSDIALPEAALLVGMFNNPSYYNPITYPDHAKSRQKTVLDLMVRHGYINEEEARAAADIPVESLLKKQEEKRTDDQGYQAFIEYVIEDIKKKTGTDPAETPMAIYTTLDKSIQNVLTQLENGDLYTFVDDKVQNGMAVTSTKDGSILALAPGRNYIKTGTNRALDRKQPGSTAKIIFDYGPLIEYKNASTGMYFFDEPYTYSSGTSIRNYDGRHKGIINMRDALIDSRNIPALQAFQATSMEEKIEFIHNLGIDYGENLYESASIGGYDGTSPLEMSAAYATFGRGGYYIEPYSFTKIVYLETEEEYNYKYTKTRVMSEETAYMITDILVDGGASGVGGSIHVSGTDVAAKGGTTTIDEAQAKALGIPTSATPAHWNNVYTPDYSISLWYGYDKLTDGYTTSTPGSKARRGIMAAVANKILPKNARFSKPSGVVSATVEVGTVPLELASSHTPENLRRTELFKSGTEPTTVSNRFDTLANPTNGNALINGSSITLTWNAIPTPDAIDTNKLQTYFNENYKDWAQKYYEERISYNAGNIGSLGYQVYLDNNGTLISLGYTNQTSYTYVAQSAQKYKFVIKSAYSIFKSNMSSGLTITADLSNQSSDTSRNGDTSLKTLIPSTGKLSPTFNPNILNYRLTVPKNTDSITFNATPNASTSHVNVKPCNLNETNNCQIVVTAENQTSKTYVINIDKTN